MFSYKQKNATVHLTANHTEWTISKIRSDYSCLIKAVNNSLSSVSRDRGEPMDWSDSDDMSESKCES